MSNPSGRDQAATAKAASVPPKTRAQRRAAERGKPDPTHDRDWWSVPEWAEQVGVTKNTAYAMAASGQIPGCVRLGPRLYRISKVAWARHFHGDAA